MTFYSLGYFANFIYNDPSWTAKESSTLTPVTS